MYLGVDYFPFDTSESITLGMNFINDLASGDSVSTATVTCTVADDSMVPDPIPSTRITAGPFNFSPTIVTYTFSNPVPGCKYLISITIQSAAGEIITDYSHISCEVPL